MFSTSMGYELTYGTDEMMFDDRGTEVWGPSFGD